VPSSFQFESPQRLIGKVSPGWPPHYFNSSIAHKTMGGNQVTSGLFPLGGGVQLELHFVVSEMQITPVYGACQEQNTTYCTVTTLVLQGNPK
jgi:hypothetical protein